MSNKYGLAAVDAVHSILRREFIDPRDAWDAALVRYYESSSSSFKKGCPRNAFLGLCEEGMVKGVKAGDYTDSKDNKAYALKAIELIQKESSLVNDISYLWDGATGDKSLVHNSQMNVVVELYEHGLINF